MSDLEIFNQFEGEIRKVWDQQSEEWWYAVVDVVAILSDSPDPAGYWRKMKFRDLKEVVPFWNDFPLKHKTNNRTYKTNCANQAGLLRIIQSVPSSKAEPFKQWLAMTGNRRLNEIKANPVEAERERLRLLGFSDQEIERHLGRYSVHTKLTAQWKDRSVDHDQSEQLIDEVHKGTFDGMTREDHKTLKKVDQAEPVYDHMTATELAFSILGDASTLDDIEAKNPQGFDENLEAAKRGGKIAGELRAVYEEKIGRKVISNKSPLAEKRKQLPDQSSDSIAND